MLIILYGASGSGKNFIGQWLARKYDFYFYDADLELTDEMIQRLKSQKAFTKVMRDKFIDRVIAKLLKLSNLHSKLVIAQALSQNYHRLLLRKIFPHALFIYISVHTEILKQRLASRNNIIQPVWVDKLLAVQQPPCIQDLVLDNNFDEQHLEKQMNKIFANYAIIKVD